MKAIVYYTDDTEQTYECVGVSYDTNVAFIKITTERNVCIPYCNVYAIAEYDE